MRNLVILVSAVFFYCSAIQAAVPFTYSYSGVGFHLGFDVLDNVMNELDVAFDAGAQGDIAFSLGPVGEAHYCPSMGMWFSGTDLYNNHYFAMEWYFNVGDARYYFPIPATIKVRPFIGLGPMIAIDYHRIEYPSPVPEDHYTHITGGLNVFTGFDVRIAPSISLTAEMRAKTGEWNAFKFSGGMTFIVNGR